MTTENKISATVILVVVLDSPERIEIFQDCSYVDCYFQAHSVSSTRLDLQIHHYYFDIDGLEVSMSFDGFPNGIDILFSS